MAYTIRVLIITILSSFLFSSCDNELKVAADWEEVTVVYGLVGASYDTNYIRIQRAYLDPVRGALEFVDEADSLYYDSLEVYLTEVHEGQEGNTYRLRPVDANAVGSTKDSGLFNRDGHRLYMLTDPIRRSNSANSYEYRLTIVNPGTGHVVRSSTKSLGWAEIQNPIRDFTDSLLIPWDSNAKIVAAYKEGVYARAYDMVMRIRVLEIDKDDPSKREIVEMDWTLIKGKKTQRIEGLLDITQVIPAKAFFNVLKANLDSTRNVNRRLYNFDLYTTGIGEDLYTYLAVNEPSIGIVQKKPEYTNVENGYGIFSSRYVNSIEGKHFHSYTAQAVRLSDKTAHLGFE